MKNLYYLLASVVLFIGSCKPLDITYKAIDATPVAPNTTLSFILTVADYQLLPNSNYAYSSLNFKNSSDANSSIPTILAAKYPNAANLVGVNATFALQTSASDIASPDITVSRISITLAAPADYVYPSFVNQGNTIAGNTLGYFTTATAQNYLMYKFPTPAANQMVILNYLYFETGVTGAVGTQTTDTYIYIGGTWTKVYTISPAQYASINRGANNTFLSTDASNLVYYVNNFLKSDLSVMVSVKTGDTKYVSYRYATTSQEILTLTYDGTNWVSKQTLSFLKINGVWLPDPTVIITEPVGVNADYAYLGTLNIGSAAARSNLASFGDFNIQSSSSTSYWSDDDIKAAFAAILLHRIANPVIGLPYKVVYSVYTGSVTVTSKNYLFDGTVFVPQ